MKSVTPFDGIQACSAHRWPYNGTTCTDASILQNASAGPSRSRTAGNYGNRDMLAANDLVVGWIKSVPARAGNVDFRPSMRGAVLTFAHLDVASDESRPKPPMPRAFHHEHREIAARSTAERQRLVWQLDSGLLAPGIFE